MKRKLPIISGLIIGLVALGYLLYLISPGWNETIDWRGIVFEAALFLFVFSWNLVVLPHWQSTKTLSLGSLLFLVGSFTDVHDEFFTQPFWVNMFVEDPSQALGAGLIGLGIWFWVREKEHLLDQLQKERDFEASLIPKLSHDLRVPLTNLCGMSGIAEEDPQFLENPARRREFLEVMMRGAKEMCLLIDNILESHHLKSGTVELKLSSVSLVPLLDETCKDFYYQTRRKEITIVRDGPQELTLEVDRAKVMRIVQNLLANAIKFSPRGGKIALNTRSNNGEITIRVMDEGQGIEADQIPMIMQESPAMKKAGAGGEDKSYGIGLKVVREFVYLHGGRFWVEPNSPKGTQFCFTLPLRQADPNPKSKI